MTHPLSVKFELGQTVATPGALVAIHPQDLFECMVRHANGDWGELDDEDKAENELSLREGYRLLSAYTDRNGTKFWIITEADRSYTTTLLPSEY